jgi:hypothetical protein
VNENLKKLLKEIFAIDTIAGQNLRYHIQRSLSCKDYSNKLGFLQKEGTLPYLFLWHSTSEGFDYWESIHAFWKERFQYKG